MLSKKLLGLLSLMGLLALSWFVLGLLFQRELMACAGFTSLLGVLALGFNALEGREAQREKEDREIEREEAKKDRERERLRTGFYLEEWCRARETRIQIE